MKLLIATVAILSLFGCTQNSSNNAQPNMSEPDITSTTKVDISKMVSSHGVMDFGGIDQSVQMAPTAGPSQPNVRARIVLKNPLDTALSFSLTPPVQEYFKIVSNRCVSPLEGKSSCSIIIQFSGRELYNGSYNDAILVADLGGSTDSIGLQLLASVDGKPDPDSTGKPVLEMTMAQGFGDDILSQDVVIKNTGDGTAKGLSTELSSNYGQRLSYCPSNLKPGKTCRVKLFNKNFRIAPAANDMMTLKTVDSGADSQLTLTANVNYKYPRNCLDAINRGLRNNKNDPAETHKSGVYTIDKDGSLPGETPYKVYCDQTTAGGGWTAVANVWMAGTSAPDPDMAEAGQYVINQNVSTIEFNSVRLRCQRLGLGIDEARSLPPGQTTTNLNVFGDNGYGNTTVFYNNGGGGGNWSTQNNNNIYSEMHWYGGLYQRLFFRVNEIDCLIDYQVYGAQSPYTGQFGEIFVR